MEGDPVRRAADRQVPVCAAPTGDAGVDRRAGRHRVRGHAPAAQEPLADGNSGPQDEDCLFLTIWSRSTRGRKPVIVWMTGWGIRAGAGSNFDGTAYAQQHDVVLVTINYRVNAFGYLYQPDRPGSGNCGLLDEIEALRWVRANITAFGGDPRNVTVMGQSAGGMSIGILLGTPAARGLFHRAIIQSGGAQPTVMQQGKDATTHATLRALGLGQDQADRLIDVPAKDLLAATAEVNKGTEICSEPFHPLIDNVVLHTHPLNRIPADVDLLIGTCDRDYLPDPTWQSEMEFVIRYAAGDKGFDRLLQIYAESTSTGRDARMDLLGSAFVQMPSIWLAEQAHRVGARVAVHLPLRRRQLRRRHAHLLHSLHLRRTHPRAAGPRRRLRQCAASRRWHGRLFQLLRTNRQSGNSSSPSLAGVHPRQPSHHVV
ncbi:carboxylesterase family protein [Streptomyces sp. ISID311]|uniref:carboxylesterase family protein n=1 Tax=Streptomyces sp. ISID311 TaxID=2601673 RepID=UPI0011BD3087|nr:carboxylesterase family protein [Streptomyces sp. ISID311]TXC99485.1 carboxylesterase family protein [Streptomyces sp. ISID311]